MFIFLPIFPIFAAASSIISVVTAATVAGTAVNLAFHCNKLCKESKKKEENND